MIRSVLASILCLAATLANAQEPVKKPDRPLIFIPGILGSQLWIDGNQSWGDTQSLIHLDRLKIPGGPKHVEPMATCGPGTQTGDCGLIERFGVLGPIKVAQYVGLIRHLESIGYVRTGPSRNLFIFPYDWRRSNFDTAAALKAFIDSTPGLAGRDFDVLAHSMGGLVALIYAHRYDAPPPGEDCASSARCHMKTVITAGTPYFGSMNAVAIPIEGWGWVSRRLAGGSETIAATVLSWPSFYELLPTYGDCCGSASTMADYATFERLPYAGGAAAPDATAVQAALQSRRDLDALARKGWPEHIAARSKQCSDDVSRDRLYLIAGDHNDTKFQVTFSGGEVSYDERRGDGTVLMRSASLNSPGQAWLSFTPHSTILDDANVRAKIETILLRCQFSLTNFAAEVPVITLGKTSGGDVDVPIDTASAHIIQDASTTASTFSVTASVALAPPTDEVDPPSATLSATVDGQPFLNTELKLTEVKQEGANRRFAYALKGLSLPRPGLLQIKVTFADSVTVSDQAMGF